MAWKSYSWFKMVPMLLVMGTLFFLSHQRGDELHLPNFSHSDLLAHMLAYTVLGCTLILAFSDQYRRENRQRVIFFTIAGCLLYGISDEFHQAFIPGRFVSILDVLADTFGGILACGLWWLASGKNFFLKSS